MRAIFLLLALAAAATANHWYDSIILGHEECTAEKLTALYDQFTMTIKVPGHHVYQSAPSVDRKAQFDKNVKGWIAHNLNKDNTW